jgi:D-sedoheptulose 7-phosphate isomerase
MNRISKILIKAFENGNKLMIVGNGGSAAMAQHMAAEFVCKFEHDREPLPAIALTTDTSALTAIGNDYGFDHIFSRQVTALRKPGDVLILLSTSGKSENIIVAKNRAELWKQLVVIDFPRKGKTTAKIQEYQFKLMHDICREVENYFL